MFNLFSVRVSGVRASCLPVAHDGAFLYFFCYLYSFLCFRCCKLMDSMCSLIICFIFLIYYIFSSLMYFFLLMNFLILHFILLIYLGLYPQINFFTDSPHFLHFQFYDFSYFYFVNSNCIDKYY